MHDGHHPLPLQLNATIHVLLEGMFQLDVNFSLGLLSQGRVNVGLFVLLYKIY